MRSLPAERSSLPDLLEAALDPSPHVAAAALERVVELGDEREAAILRPRVLNADPSLVPAYARALRALGDGEGAVQLAREALGDEDAHVRVAAATVLRVLRDEPASPELCRALDDPMAAVRRASLDALRALTPDQSTIDACVRCLADVDPMVRTAAVRAVVELTDDPRSPAFRSLMDVDARVRAAFAAYASRLEPPTVAALLRDRDANVRVAVLQALEERPRWEHAEAVVKAVGDESWHVRAAACRAAAAGRVDSAYGALVRALVDPHPTVRASALNALRAIFGEKIAELLADEIPTAPVRLRQALIYAIHAIDVRALESHLGRLALDPEPRVRIAAVHAARSLRSSETAVAVLVRLRSDPDPSVAHAARAELDR